MNTEVLTPGINFVIKYNLSAKEIKTLSYFFKKTYTLVELVEVLKEHRTTLHAIIQRLKLRGLLIIEKRDSKGSCTYQLNSEIED